MKTITLAQAIEILADCSAVIVDDSTVTYPNVFEADNNEDGIFLEVETRATEQFCESDNETASVDDKGRIILVNTFNENTAFMPLYARPVV
jgi:hypothetical protein